MGTAPHILCGTQDIPPGYRASLTGRRSGCEGCNESEMAYLKRPLQIDPGDPNTHMRLQWIARGVP
jgi:hypothetical protein